MKISISPDFLLVTSLKVRITRYPNNETRVAVYPERLPRQSDFGAIDSNEEKDSTIAPPVQGCSEPLGDASRTLDINFKVETPSRARRLTLSRYGRRRLVRAGSCFSQGEDSVRLLLTGTLPGSSREAFRVLADNSSYVTHRLCNWLTRRQRSAKWMYTWEFQKRGALHLHLVIEVDNANAEFIKREFKHEWNRLLNTIGNRNGIDMWRKSATYSHSKDVTQADVTVCDKEPSRYISKYISKGNAKSFGANRFPPVRWYQISRALLRELEDKTEVYEREALSYGQARQFVEIATHNLYHYQLCGSREFRGIVYAWSGYGYGEDFEIGDYGGGFVNKSKQNDNSLIIAKRLHALSRNYPLMRCRMHSKGHSAMATRVTTGVATREETHQYIEMMMEIAMLSYDDCNNKGYMSLVLRDTDIWLSHALGKVLMPPEFSLRVNKNCEELLTG